MRKLLATLLIATMPLAGVAQSLAPNGLPFDGSRLQPVIDDQAARADMRGIPLWGTPDGRVLAMVSANGGAYPTLPKTPQLAGAPEWRLIDVTSAVSASVLTHINDKSSVHFDVGRTTLLSPLPAPGCAPAQADCANASLAVGGALRMGLDWLAGDDFSIDLSYGLSWLRRNSSLPGDRAIPVFDSLAGLGNPALPGLVIPGVDLANAQSASINALGRLRVNDEQSVDIGASLSRIQLSIPGSAPLTSLNQAAVSFGLEYGSFTGTLTTHVLGAADVIGSASPSPRLTGLDVGISWRTPWRGMFSVGAQNLWSTGSLPLAVPAYREADPGQARVPYVQYHQDL
ncbi:MAG: hypothetical protein ABI846_09980 [Rudaea sp.]